MKKQTRLFTALLAFAIMATPPAILAQDDLLADAQTVLNQEQIDISGDFDAPEEKSPEEMVEEARQTNEKKNVKRISKKVANLKVSKKEVKQITTKESKNLSGRISNIFGIGNDQDSVSTTQSSTTKKVVVAKIEAPKQADLGKESIRVIPSVGVQSIQGTGINFESKYSTGLVLESMVTSNIAVGFGVNYSALNIKDIKNNDFSFQNYNYDELEYSHLALTAQGKYFFSRGKFRPYIGVGVAFNRTSLEYNTSSNSSSSSSNFNNSYYGSNYNDNNNSDLTEEYSESYVSGTMSVGAEVKFSKNVGAVVEGSYSRGLTDGFNSQAVYNTSKQVRLDEIGGAISSSNFYALNAGLLVTF